MRRGSCLATSALPPYAARGSSTSDIPAARRNGRRRSPMSGRRNSLRPTWTGNSPRRPTLAVSSRSGSQRCAPSLNSRSARSLLMQPSAISLRSQPRAMLRVEVWNRKPWRPAISGRSMPPSWPPAPIASPQRAARGPSAAIQAWKSSRAVPLPVCAQSARK